MTAPVEDGDGAVRVDAGGARVAPAFGPTQVDYINAHGTSTPHNDRIETTAIKRTFGEHALQARDLVDQVDDRPPARRRRRPRGRHHARCRSRTRWSPPTINLDEPDEGCDLDYVPNTAREMKIDYALSNSFGFGGTNGALLFKRYEE